VTSGAGLPLGWEDVRGGRLGRAPGGVEVGTGAPLPVGPSDSPVRRRGRTPGAVAVGTGARCALRRAGGHTRRCAVLRWKIFDTEMHHISLAFKLYC